jgi:hypothetical protein
VRQEALAAPVHLAERVVAADAEAAIGDGEAEVADAEAVDRVWPTLGAALPATVPDVR